MTSQPRLTERRSHDRWRSRAPLALGVAVLVVWFWTFSLESGVSLSGLWGLESREHSADSDRFLFGDPDTPLVSESLDESFYLPYEIKGWRMAGPQPVPGAEAIAVECWFNPEDDERNLVIPLIVYVQAHRYPGAAEAQLGPLMQRYPAGVSDVVVGGVQATTGRTDDAGSLGIVWAEQDVLYHVDATFTHYIPESVLAVETLRAAAEEIASAIAVYRAAQGGAE